MYRSMYLYIRAISNFVNSYVSKKSFCSSSVLVFLMCKNKFNKSFLSILNSWHKFWMNVLLLYSVLYFVSTFVKRISELLLYLLGLCSQLWYWLFVSNVFIRDFFQDHDIASSRNELKTKIKQMLNGNRYNYNMNNREKIFKEYIHRFDGNSTSRLLEQLEL